LLSVSGRLEKRKFGNAIDWSASDVRVGIAPIEIVFHGRICLIPSRKAFLCKQGRFKFVVIWTRLSVAPSLFADVGLGNAKQSGPEMMDLPAGLH
jgi:hypothetical protein